MTFRHAFAVLTLAGAVLTAAPAAAQSGLVDRLLTKADGVYALHDYAKAGWEKQGILRKGAEASFTLTLTGGKEYSLIGVCDADCENLDIYVTDDKGVEITRDVETDDYPVVYIKRGGAVTLNVRVVMVGCKDSPCEYGLKTFRM